MYSYILHIFLNYKHNLFIQYISIEHLLHVNCRANKLCIYRKKKKKKNTRVGTHFLLQGIFPIQGLNPCLLCFLSTT